MSAGLFALLDDVAALARVAAASIDDVAAGAGRASLKAAGVVVDDTAVTPRFVRGAGSDRELPMIRRIAVGSIRNKLVFILPVALLLSEFIPWLLTPLLMIGGTYLSYEGAEKIWEFFSHHKGEEAPVAELGPEAEETLVKGAIRTDFILSAEIMVIALNEVSDQAFLQRALILVVVAILITAAVYGAVALIVRMDDAGLRLADSGTGAVAAFGRGLVRAMPVVLSVISIIGIGAMLWVGGYIVLSGLKDLGFSAPYELVDDFEGAAGDLLGGVGAWVANTAGAALMGLIVGAIVIAIMHLRPKSGSGAA